MEYKYFKFNKNFIPKLGFSFCPSFFFLCYDKIWKKKQIGGEKVYFSSQLQIKSILEDKSKWLELKAAGYMSLQKEENEGRKLKLATVQLHFSMLCSQESLVQGMVLCCWIFFYML